MGMTARQRSRRRSYTGGGYVRSVERMTTDFNRTALGIAGIGAVTSLSVGLLGAIRR